MTGVSSDQVPPYDAALPPADGPGAPPPSPEALMDADPEKIAQQLHELNKTYIDRAIDKAIARTLLTMVVAVALLIVLRHYL